MRKLEAFGQADAPVDFQWPRKQDLESMPADGSVRLVGFEFKNIDCGNYQGIAAISLLFTNGVRTPIFATQGTPTDPM